MSKREEKAKTEAASEFALPEFDERAFVRKEIHGTRATIALVGVGAALGFLSSLVGGATLWTASVQALLLVVVLMYVGAVLLTIVLTPFLLRLGIAGEVLDRRGAIGLGFWMFTAWLSVWVLLLNAW